MSKITAYSAPMAGVSDYPFRQMVRLFGHQPLFTEMIGVDTLVHNHPKTLKMLTFKKEKNIVVQLVGSKPANMAKAAALLTDYGVVGIDINMGCPVKKLIQNHSGAMLMKDVDLACHLVTAVKANTCLPVSVKTRLGWHSPDEILTFAPRLVSAGVDRIEIHTRTKEQGYAGQAYWSVLRNLKLPVPVIVNGDSTNQISAKIAMKESGAEAVMIGRALLGRPWKLAEIETGVRPQIDMPNLVLTHLDLMLSHYGYAGLYAARKHLAWYAAHKKGVAKWREKMYLEENEKRLKKLIQDFWEGEGR